jgi:hypothetical protein
MPLTNDEAEEHLEFHGWTHGLEGWQPPEDLARYGLIGAIDDPHEALSRLLEWAMARASNDAYCAAIVDQIAPLLRE